ncbi:efflux RND transporter periplasmic adaptor subunit [Nitrospirota bacterium]
MKAIIKILLPLIILALGIGFTILMVMKRETPMKNPVAQTGVLVTTSAVESGTHKITVRGSAKVQPSEQVSVISQVSGKVVRVSPKFVTGGIIPKGGLLFEIDDTDYRLELDRTLSTLARAEYEYESVLRQAEIARLEWETLSGSDELPNPLVLFEPQLKNARASLEAAEAQIALAELRVKRTTLRAPFDSRVRTEQISFGQFVMTGSPVATLAGTTKAEITVAVSTEDLAWITIPARKNTARVYQDSDTSVFKGTVLRSAGEVDPQTHMVNVIVEVRDPFGLKRAEGGELLYGSFVEVEIEGQELSDVFVLPRKILRDDSTVWTMESTGVSTGVLRIKPVEVLRIEGDEVIVRAIVGEKELLTGEQIVTTNISGAVDGMKLRSTEGPGK